uniref:HSF-type DNA-binding domain-containing protein n=1 Tax=Cynoglossus semilaevis TaxID=244447 RepID=A0A3P8VRL1_CYNSE
MEAGLTVLPENINPSTFPAKLWRLVNNPASTAICWDHLGKAIVINQERFESQILSSTSSPNLDNTGSFKTTNFCSFVRQLNLYGFKKISPINAHVSLWENQLQCLICPQGGAVIITYCT